MTPQEKVSKFHILLYMIRTHYTEGQYTCGHCINKCGNSARGGKTFQAAGIEQ